MTAAVINVDFEQTLSYSSPLRSARAMLNAVFWHENQRKIHYLNGEFLLWTGQHYEVASFDQIRTEAYLYLEKCKIATKSKDGSFDVSPYHPNLSRVTQVIDALKAESALINTISPSWLDQHAGDPEPQDIVSCANGLLDIQNEVLIEHTPAFFIRNSVNYRYDKNSPNPSQWLHFLQQLWPDDPDSILALQQMFGYLLTGDTRQQKAFLLVGPKRSGKGTIARILTALIGQENVAGPTLSALASQFGMEPLIAKRLALISDARFGGRIDQTIVTERILAVTGEDFLTIDRKNKTMWSGKLDTRFLILSNELPRLTDTSGALASRFVLLTLENSFIGQEDKTLTERLMGDLPGIFNWALDGRKLLHETGKFIQPESSKEALHEMEDLASPTSLFLRDKCVLDPALHIECMALFDVWQTWCRDNGRTHSGSLQGFGKDLRSVMPTLKIRQLTNQVTGEKQRHYMGIGTRQT